MVKIATWNVNSLRVRLPQVMAWLQAEQPDILALQETKVPDADFPQDALTALGYQAYFSGEKSYNGVALLSRRPAVEIITALPGLPAEQQRRVLGATIAGIRLLNLYAPNGQAVGSEKYAYKLMWLDRLADYLKEQIAVYPRLVAVGDFNIAPDDRDVHDPAAWAGQVLCSDPERLALQRLLRLGLTDVFRLFEPASGGYSWWDYRAASFRRNQGLRIDLILASPTLAQACVDCRIDKAARAQERPSDHAPVIAEFAID